jgi:hypothetical protein
MKSSSRKREDNERKFPSLVGISSTCRVKGRGVGVISLDLQRAVTFFRGLALSGKVSEVQGSVKAIASSVLEEGYFFPLLFHKILFGYFNFPMAKNDVEALLEQLISSLKSSLQLLTADDTRAHLDATLHNDARLPEKKLATMAI